MRLTRLILSAVLTAGVAVPAVAQLRANRPPQQQQNLPRLFVANPYVYSSTDSTAAVRVGDGLRKRVADVADKWFRTITREQMNEALLQYAYPADAVLSPVVARTLANTLQARVMVGGSMFKGDNNHYTASIRVVGMNDKAGYLVNLTQAPNQSLEEFGTKLGDQIASAFRALPDARECWDNQIQKPDKAIAAAKKALATLPNHGLAEFCLGEIHLAQKSPTDSILTHFKNAAKGDSLSLDAHNNLLVQYQLAKDSNAVIETLKQMLRIAPTNEKLRQDAFKVFLAYDRANEALNVANEAIELDPTNPDWYDLKSNACVFLDDYPCAVTELEKVYAIDPSKADSAFFLKIAVFASQQPDTVRLLKWTRLGVSKYPDNASLLDYLVKAYSYAGPVDSLVAVTKRYIAVDSSEVTPVLVAVQALVGAKRFMEAYPLGDIVDRLGDQAAKNTYASLLYQAVQPLFANQPIDYQAAADLTRRIVKASSNPQITAAAQFYRGVAVYQLVLALDNEVLAAKSCDKIPELETLVNEAGEAIKAGQSVAPEYAAPIIKGVEGYPQRLAQLRKAYCK